MVPLPSYNRTLTPVALETFIRDHPDFRASTLQAVNLPSPFILATTELNPDTIYNNILPHAAAISEGSILGPRSPHTTHLDHTT